MTRPFFIALTLSLAGCESHDIGRPCPELGANDPHEPGEGRVETQEVVEYNVSFPCDELVCVATAGRAGYCSKGCREDGGCPEGFVCREVQPAGAFKGKKFCVWKTCQSDGDCGNVDDLCCATTPDSDPLVESKLCAFRGNTCG